MDGAILPAVINYAVINTCSVRRFINPGGLGSMQQLMQCQQNRFFCVTSVAACLIRSVMNASCVAAPVVKTYTYNEARPNYILSNFYFFTTQTYVYYEWTGAVAPLNCYMRVRTFMSNPTLDYRPFDQSLVVYPKVTEYVGDISNNTGKTEYTFSDAGDIITTSTSVQPRVISYFVKRGLLTEKLVYKNNGAQNSQLIHKEHYEYFAFPEKTISNIAFVVFQNAIPQGPGVNALIPAQRYGYWYFNNYDIRSQDNYLIKEEISDVDPLNSANLVVTTLNYNHGNIVHQQVTSTTNFNSKGKKITTYFKYPLDYTVGSNPTDNTAKGIKILQDKRIVNVPIEQYVQQSNADGTDTRTLSGSFTTFKTAKPYAYINYKIENNSSLGDFTPATITASSSTKDSRYKQKMIFDTYDSYGNMLQQHKANDVNHSYIWDYNHDYPIAEAINAPQNQIAYTSFEADGTGNWTVGSTARNTTTPVTGLKSYNLTNGNVVSPSLPAGSYKVTVWAKSAPTVSGTNTKHITGRKFNNFTYHEFWVTLSATAAITVSGSGLIDELRLYPANAQMMTYTYKPLIGMTSQCDINNDISYYEYDGLGRLALIRDMDNNIMKKYGYNYAGQQFKPNQFISSLQTKTFVKNDCSDTENISGSEVEDTVEEGMFESDSSQAEADSLAKAYLDSTGQANANVNGTCLPLLQLLLANYDRIAGFTIKLTSVVDTARTYTIAFPEDSDSAMSLQRIPQGRYDIEVSKPDNTESYVFTVSGPEGDIQINARNASWANVPVTAATFTKIAIGIRQQ